MQTHCGYSSVVEHNLAKVGVEGSSPFARSMVFIGKKMARVTVEDCEVLVPNRFQLVVLASQRVKQIQNGAPLTIARDEDKDTVVSLREIAYKTVSLDALKDAVVDSFRQTAFMEDDDDDEDDDNYDPAAFNLEVGKSQNDNFVEPDAAVDFSCIIQEAEDSDE